MTSRQKHFALCNTTEGSQVCSFRTVYFPHFALLCGGEWDREGKEKKTRETTKTGKQQKTKSTGKGDEIKQQKHKKKSTGKKEEIECILKNACPAQKKKCGCISLVMFGAVLLSLFVVAGRLNQLFDHIYTAGHRDKPQEKRTKAWTGLQT